MAITDRLFWKASLWVLLTLLGWTIGVLQAGAAPGVIIDQDMSSDHDDVADLALVDALANLGECTLLACMTDSTNGGTPLCQNAINTYYGFPNVPCGIRPDSGGLGGYPATIASEFPHPLYASYTQCPLAVNLYRQVLASQPDHSVVIVTTGYLNNLEALLQSAPDQYSSLSGPALVAQKVKLLACAGGQYPTGGEFNFTVEPEASSYTINNWPAGSPILYTGYELGGNEVTGGALQATPLTNPVRRAWELTFWGPYPTWGQQAGYSGIRAIESAVLWNQETTGYNTVASNGVNTWDMTGTPGQYSQAYLLDKVRFPLQESLNTLVMAPPPSVSAPPSQPTDVRATVVSANSINLQWTDNSYSETGFKIERGINGVYSQVGAVGANVTTYSDTGLTSTADVSYRVKATNSVADSPYSYIWVYSGWTETNFSSPGSLPLYNYFQTCDLEPAGTVTQSNHVTINNDSNHGQDVTINVMVSGTGNGVPFYIYFFYQDPNHWYRANVSSNSSKFEKDLGGTITQIGASGAGVGVGGALQQWKVIVSHTGSLQFLTDWGTNETVSPQSVAILNVNDTLSYSSGKIGLGGNGSAPVWQNFNFNTLTNVAQPPASPTGVTATPGNGQIALAWAAVPGATSYNVYQARDSEGESATPLASNLTSTSFTQTGLTNGTTSFYKVAAVNSTGISSYSYEVSATPGTTITTLISNGTYEIAPLSTGMAITITGSTATPSVVQQPYAGSASQQWTLTNLGNNVVELVCFGNGLALEAPGATPVNGAYLDTGIYGGGSYQLWQLAASGTGYQIINLNSELGANVAFNSSQAGVGIVQYAISNAANSVFTFTSVGAGGGGTTPTAPTGLAATSGNAQVGLTWTASGGATSYNIYRGTTPGGEGTSPIATGITVGSYADSMVTNGTTYYYTVKAVNGTNVSPSSNEASAMPSGPVSPPAAPKGLVATAGNSVVNLIFSASSGASSYNIYRGTAAGGESSTPIATGVSSGAYADSAVVNGTTYYYEVAAVNAAGVSGYSNEASATPVASGSSGGSLPSPWLNEDIGSPGAAGGATYSGGTFTLTGAGSGAYYSPDSLQLADQAVTGDCSITALVASQTSPNGGAKAGVMIRDGLAGTAGFADMIVVPNSGGTYFQYRPDSGSPNSYVSSGTAPYWMRLTRVGNVFTGSVSPDGTNWTQVGSATIPLPTAVYIGLSQASGTYGTLGSSTFSNVTITGPTVVPTLTSAVSRQVHGAAGTFDLPLALTGTPTIECRQGAISGSYSLVLTFSQAVQSLTASLGLQSGQAGSAVGVAQTPVVSGNTVTVNLIGVENRQRLNLHLSAVLPGAGTVDVPLNILWGDVNQNGLVSTSDVNIVRAATGAAVTAQNYLDDVNANGVLSTSDVNLVRAASGTALP